MPAPSMSSGEKRAITDLLIKLYDAEIITTHSDFESYAYLTLHIDDTTYTYIATGESNEQAKSAVIDKFCDAVWSATTSIIKKLCIGVKTHVESTNPTGS